MRFFSVSFRFCLKMFSSVHFTDWSKWLFFSKRFLLYICAAQWMKIEKLEKYAYFRFVLFIYSHYIIVAYKILNSICRNSFIDPLHICNWLECVFCFHCLSSRSSLWNIRYKCKCTIQLNSIETVKRNWVVLRKFLFI